MLRISDLTLEKAIDMVRSAEATEIQLRDMANDSALRGIGEAKKKPPFRKTPSANEERPSSSKIFNSRNCGTRYNVIKCPAYCKTFHNCKKQHHFQSSCWSQRKVHGLMADKEEENNCEPPLFVEAVTTEVQIPNDERYVTLSVQGHLVRLKVDTDSEVNIMPQKELKEIEGDNPQIHLCNQKLARYSEDNLKVLGIIKLPVKSKLDFEQELTVHAVETNQPGLLGLRSSQNVGLMKVVMTAKTEGEETTTDHSSQTTKTSQELKEEDFQKYAQGFTGLHWVFRETLSP